MDPNDPTQIKKHIKRITVKIFKKIAFADTCRINFSFSVVTAGRTAVNYAPIRTQLVLQAEATGQRLEGKSTSNVPFSLADFRKLINLKPFVTPFAAQLLQHGGQQNMYHPYSQVLDESAFAAQTICKLSFSSGFDPASVCILRDVDYREFNNAAISVKYRSLVSE